MHIKPFKTALVCLFFIASAMTHASVTVFVQNIEAYKLCADNGKKDRLKQFIKNNNFDFILTQEYEGICDGLFNEIKNMGYSIAGTSADATLFFKNADWYPNKAPLNDTANITFNTPDGWGHDGTRQFVVGSYTHKGTNFNLCMGTTHLCVNYPGSHGPSICVADSNLAKPENCKMNTCVQNQMQAHLRDFSAMILDLKPCTNWVVAGDLNTGFDEKNQLMTQFQSIGVKNINELNKQAFDMAFFRGNQIKDMKYTPATELQGISDHMGFILTFNLISP